MLAWFGKAAFGEPETAHVMLAAKQALLSGLCKALIDPDGDCKMQT